MVEGRLAKPGEVDGDGVVVLGQRGADRHPVQGIAAQAVDHEQRFALATEVDVVDRAVEVGDPMAHCVNPTMRESKSRPPIASGSRRWRLTSAGRPGGARPTPPTRSDAPSR